VYYLAHEKRRQGVAAPSRREMLLFWLLKK
jgi:hypothetical protein